MDIENLIEQYIKAKANSWSESTQRSERYRLRSLDLSHLTKPEKLWHYLTKERKLKPYAAKTAFIRAGELLDFAMKLGEIKQGPNVLKEWMADNAKLFKHAYKRKPVGMTFDEALERINNLEDVGIRDKAIQLLATGMRITESMNVDDNGQVEGKGGGTRTVPLAKEHKAETFTKSADTFRRHLKSIGLTPHQLRKLAATKAAELGADIPDLMAWFGWRSAQMAAIYLQEQKQKEIAEKMGEAMKKGKKKDGK